MSFATVDELLADARSQINRLSPHEAHLHQSEGSVIVDIRPAWQRAEYGEIPGSLIVERNHLEWRLHPESGAHLPVASQNRHWIVVCTEGYTSSLAAAALTSIGLHASDIDGGIEAWRLAGLPVTRSVTGIERFVRGDSVAVHDRV